MTVREIWKDIERFLEKNSEYLHSSLEEGALEADILEFEKQIGFRLPEDYRESILIHSGDLYLSDYSYLRLNTVAKKWKSKTESFQQNINKYPVDKMYIMDCDVGIIQNLPWSRNWIPVLEDGGGNCICIDMDPGPKGKIGQILFWERETGPEASRFTSFADWLSSYRNDLYNGKYIVNEEGFLDAKD